jgi:hypothetical protein
MVTKLQVGPIPLIETGRENTKEGYFAAIPPSVSPDTTVYVPQLPAK